MNLELLEKFFLELAPPAAANAIHSLFGKLKLNPLGTSLRGIQELHFLTSDPEHPGHAPAINALMIGICLGYALQVSPETVDAIERWVKERQKEKGSNVFSFAQNRVGKGHSCLR